MLSPEGYYGKWLVAHTTIAKIDRTLFLHGGLSPRFGRLSFRDLRKQVRENLQEYFRIVDELVKLGVFHPMLGFIELYDLVSLESSTGRVDPKLVPLFRRFADVLEGAAFSSQGPLWYRGLAENSEGSFRAQVKRLLTRQQVDRIVIGHTHPAKYRITPRFGSTVYLIDTGMNQETYGGKPQALELGQARSPTVISLED